MEPYLIATDDEILEKVKNLCTFQEISDLLEISPKFLKTILYGVKERKNYSNFEIQKKSNKKRLINAPPKNISILQKKLHRVLSLIYQPKKCVYGFVNNRNIVNNASRHTKKKHILNIDLEDFFPSIHLGRIKGALMGQPFNMTDKVSTVIAQICTISDGTMPQGGPTSPIISNIVCRTLDNKLAQYANRQKCTYTRYADDITFSTNQTNFPCGIAIINQDIILSEELVKIIEDQQFKINSKKICKILAI